MSGNASTGSEESLNRSDLTASMIEETPEEHSLVESPEDTVAVAEVPAHIAARFYRPSLARRKSSAASSRRNSLSSTHSHSTARSLRRASTSATHSIAQHLRRASILESRKARLADRAAHWEQVRLRAALVKATPRGNGPSCEERTQAAHLAREKYLAKVVAACAEEVAKAKQKAQDMKVKKLDEEKRARQEMEERLAEADKRRAEYQRNLYARRVRRSSSQDKKLAPVAEDGTDATVTTIRPALDEDTAARRIQTAWLCRRRKAVVESWLTLDLTIERMRQSSFEDVSSKLMNDSTILSTVKILELFGIVKTGDASTNTDSRGFLSAYLMLSHAEAVFGKLGSQETDLAAKAQELVVLFETAVCQLSMSNRFTPSPTQKQELMQIHATFSSAFANWKARDSSTLIDTMIASFVELDAIWQTVKDDSQGHVADDFKEGIRDNQVILLSRIRKLAGPDRADVLIKKAIRESRRRRGRKRTAAEVRPRVADATDASEAPAADASALNEVRRLSDNQDNQVASGPQSFAAMFSPIPSNRIITHELAVNKDYRIPLAKQSEVRDQINRSICDSMRLGIENGEIEVWTTAMAECIRGKLLGILKAGNSMHTLISEALDSDHVYQQCSQGMFSYPKFFDFMANILPKLCAPFRDEQVKTLVEDLQSASKDTGEMIEKLFRLLHFIDLLSLDYSNFLLMNAAPMLIREAVPYEQRMFSADLESGKITLANTKRWWRNASVNALTEADRRDPEQIRLPADRPTTIKIHTRALIDLATSQDLLEETSWPETLLLDRQRCLAVRRTYLNIICIGASLLTAKNLLKRDVRAPWKAEATRLWDTLSKSDADPQDKANTIISTLSSSKSMPESSAQFLQSAVLRFCTQANATASARLSDPVLKILSQRLRTHLLLRSTTSTSQERVRAASAASESLASAGLPEFVAHIGELVDVLGRVAHVDFACHAPWYEQIAQEMHDAGDQ